ncbi:MAG: hypothetical protein C0506_14260 [Anaerolinea sp.]|nr:hypothetical protein [Anaerolinea sp.]
MRGRSAFALSVTAFVIGASLGLSSLPNGPRTARAACGGEVAEPEALFSFQPAQSPDFLVSGTAPLAVSATWLIDVLTVKGSTASLNWGDGSPPTPFTAEDCGDDTISWPVQTHRHTYASPGEYMLVWNFSIVILSQSVPVAIVSVGAAQAPTPAPTPTVAPTQAPQPTSTPVPVAPTVAPTAPPMAAATATEAAPTPAPATPTPTQQTPFTATPTPTLVATAAAPVTAASPSPPAPREPDLPQVLREMPRVEDISTDAGVIATNVALAGVTLWVLFSSVLLNQVLQDNRAEIDLKTGRLTRPLKRLARGSGGSSFGRGSAITAAVVLAVTGLIYGFLDPGFGLNRSSLLLFLSAILGVGIVTYVCSGLEATVTRRSHHLAAAVRPYPVSMAVAVASVFLSRLAHVQPGVVYGFVASCAVTGPGRVDERRQGAITIFPVVAALVLSGAALGLLELIRADEGIASSFLGQVAIGAGIIVFIGGIEGVAFNMIPLSVTDGGKLFAWRKPVWAAIALLSSFLAWHVLLNRDRESFESLRKASSLSILVIFAFYSSLSVAAWAYFRFHGRDESPAAAGPDPEAS